MKIRKIGTLTRTYRHFNRYTRILAILFKYGFGEFINRLPIHQIVGSGLQLFSKEDGGHLRRLPRSERIRMMVEELGPTFIKLAQILSTRPDLIPLELVEELSKLQDHVSPFPFSEVKQILEAELRSSLEERFEEFNEIPIAAASIGQVHRARLRGGEEVVVKVQRPGIRKTVEVDLEILFHLAELIERHFEEWGEQRPKRIVEEFSRTLEKELNYGTEASQAERFAAQFRGNPHIFVPRVFREASTGRVLTMQYVDGIKVSEVKALDELGYDRRVIASRGAELMFEQVFRHGFFHADPHPGNIFILPQNVICYIDYGMMGSVIRRSRENFADLFSAYYHRDEVKTAQIVLKIVEWDREPDRRALEKDIFDFLGVHAYRSLGQLRVDALLKELMGLISRHHLRIPPDILLMAKAVAVAEGVGLRLDPDFEMTKKAAPFVLQLKLERLRPQRILREFFLVGGDFLRFVRLLPEELENILQQIRQGGIKIGFEHRGLENFIHQLDRSSNRLSFSLIIAALIIGSSLILHANIGPFLFGFSALGVLGFSTAGIIGIGLVISILRSGKF
ncbi:MAG: ABC1 kinase family protein [Candidatus Odinarchaeota archaeon]